MAVRLEAAVRHVLSMTVLRDGRLLLLQGDHALYGSVALFTAADKALVPRY